MKSTTLSTHRLRFGQRNGSGYQNRNGGRRCRTDKFGDSRASCPKELRRAVKAAVADAFVLDAGEDTENSERCSQTTPARGYAAGIKEHEAFEAAVIEKSMSNRMRDLDPDDPERATRQWIRRAHFLRVVRTSHTLN